MIIGIQQDRLKPRQRCAQGCRLDELRRGRGEPWMVREPFALVFSTPWTVLLLEAQYQMQPIGGKPVPVYLIPTQSPPGDRRLYHAAFN